MMTMTTDLVAPDHTVAALESLLDDVRPISLAELDAAAALQKRVDSKYIVTAAQLADVIDHLAQRLAVLDIDGARSFGYESVYFDTDDQQSYLGAARSRRSRFKVRTRRYDHSGQVKLEVKTRDGRGTTLKRRRSHPSDQRFHLCPSTMAFIDDAVGEPGLGRRLHPELITSYRRTTFVDLDAVARVTVDAGLLFVDRQGRCGGLADRFVVETKSSGAPSATDRYLWELGIRPTKISKYGTGRAVLDPSLPHNKWHRTIQRHF